MNSKLSGMPELRLGLNDRVQFDSGGGDPFSLLSSLGAFIDHFLLKRSKFWKQGNRNGRCELPSVCATFKI